MPNYNGLGTLLHDDDIEGAPVDEIGEEFVLPPPQLEHHIYLNWQRPFELTRECSSYYKLMQVYDYQEHLFFTHLGGIALCMARIHAGSSDRDINLAGQQLINYFGHLFNDLSGHGHGSADLRQLRLIVSQLAGETRELSSLVPTKSITSFQPASIEYDRVVFRGSYHVT